MPSPNSTMTMNLPRFTPEELGQLPDWAIRQYIAEQKVLAQILQQVAKLEHNIGNLQTMLVKEECPRSLQFKIKISVQAEQQPAMDAALESARKQYERSMLEALIHARKQELQNRKADVDRKIQEFTDYIQSNLQKMKDNGIPLPPGDEDIKTTVELCTSIFHGRLEKINQVIQTTYFFERELKRKKEQEREAQRQEQRINEQLHDPTITNLSKQIQTLQNLVTKTLKKSQPTRPPPRSNRNRAVPKPNPGNRKTVKQTSKRHPKEQRVQIRNQRRPAQRSNPRPQPNQGHQRNPARLYKNRAASQNVVRRNPGRGRGNRGHLHRSTNTTIPLATRPTGFRNRQN